MKTALFFATLVLSFSAFARVEHDRMMPEGKSLLSHERASCPKVTKPAFSVRPHHNIEIMAIAGR